MNIAQAKEIAELLRPHNPELAAKIDNVIAKAKETGKTDGLNINVSISYRLEKFDGDKKPGQEPVEVIEGTDNI